MNAGGGSLFDRLDVLIDWGSTRRIVRGNISTMWRRDRDETESTKGGGEEGGSFSPL